MPISQRNPLSKGLLDSTIRAYSIALFALIFLTTFSLYCRAQATDSATPQYRLPPCNGSDDCDGDGGGGGGGGTPPPNYNLNWGTPATPGGTVVGGVSGREGPAVGELGTQVYVAFTSPSDPVGDQYNDNYVYVSSLNGQFSRASNLFSDANPALQYFPGNGKLYLAVSSSEGNPARYNGGFTGIFSTTTGATWSQGGEPPSQNFPFVQYSPSMAANNQYLFTGYANAADHTLTLCRFDVNEMVSCTNFPGTRAMNFNPSLAYYNGVLYIGYE